jgi:phosphinothricin acetyltransferase
MMGCDWIFREAKEYDIPRIRDIYNQGIEDRIATLEEQPKTMEEMHQWFHQRSPRYAVLVAELNGEVQGWASLNPYSHRCAYAGVADISVYIDRSWRGKGVGSRLLRALEEKAKENGFAWMPDSCIKWPITEFTNKYSEDETEDGTEVCSTAFWKLKRRGGRGGEVFIKGSFNKRFLTRKAIEELGIEADKTFVEFVEVSEKETWPKRRVF